MLIRMRTNVRLDWFAVVGFLIDLLLLLLLLTFVVVLNRGNVLRAKAGL
jgi:hypothetical protein